MKKIIKFRWAILALWLTVTLLLSVFQPNVNAILQQRGQTGLNSDSPSVIADAILEKMETTEGTTNLIIFYDKNKLFDDEMSRIKEAVTEITDNGAELGISNMIDPFSKPDAKSSLVSDDGTTLMVSFKLDKGSRDIAEIKNELDNKLSNIDVAYYLTGTDFISNDYLNASISGVEKSAILTVLFILLVLILMFRSVVTPLVSLLAVAFSYFTSMGIVAQLIDKAGFPVTTLTQVLLILILFGIGTDYNILLFNRFKEELAQGISVDDAIINTYKTAGKTILFSVMTVLIAFSGLYFSESPIFQSGIAIVIGIAVLLLEIMTLTPFAMKTLGNKIFWPSKAASGHKESRLWGKLSAASTKHPIFSVLLVVLIIGTSAIFYQQNLNFDTVGELGNAYPSSKGINLVAEHFGKGQAMPSTLVIESNRPLNNNDALSVIDQLTETIRQIDGVKEVASVTQPEGKQIDEFYISGQMSSVTDGLTSMQNGLNQISDGFTEAQSQFGSADFYKVSAMTDGTTQMRDAVSALAGGLSQLQSGLSDGAQNSETISNAVFTIESNLSDMSSGIKILSENYTTMQSGFSAMGKQYQDAANALLAIKATLSQMQMMITSLGDSYPIVKSDTNYLSLKASVGSLLSSLNTITPEDIKALNTNYDATTSGFAEANKNLELMSGGLAQMADGLKQVESGLTRSSDGIGTVVTNLNNVAKGLDEMKSGQEQLVSGLNQFGAFSANIAKVSSSLKEISHGLGQSKDFLVQFDDEKIFHIPDEALTSSDYQAAMDALMSSDRTVTKLFVVLDDDPYSKEAVNTIQKINEAVPIGLQGTVLADAKFGVSGPSSATNDMNNILSRDLNKMMLIVLAGVFLVLLLVIRSFWMPVFITLSLLGSYYTSMFVTNSIFINALNYPGLSSFVPFFAFLIIVALGVDYSIFLMMRFKEYKDLTPKDAIVMASRQIGGVVMMAVVILGGTFATLMPSGMLLLIELAVSVIVGLFVLCFIMLPIFLPATISFINRHSKS